MVTATGTNVRMYLMMVLPAGNVLSGISLIICLHVRMTTCKACHTRLPPGPQIYIYIYIYIFLSQHYCSAWQPRSQYGREMRRLHKGIAAVLPPPLYIERRVDNARFGAGNGLQSNIRVMSFIMALLIHIRTFLISREFNCCTQISRLHCRLVF